MLRFQGLGFGDITQRMEKQMENNIETEGCTGAYRIVYCMGPSKYR